MQAMPILTSARSWADGLNRFAPLWRQISSLVSFPARLVKDPVVEAPDSARGRSMATADSGRLSEIARLFFRLGVIGFGGPAAHLVLMERETVDRRGWLTREEFVDLLG